MSSIHYLKKLLNKPFPQEERFVHVLRIIGAISVFVVFFLYVFQPFGIHLLKDTAFVWCAGFGLVTFLASIVYEWIIRHVVKVKGPKARFTFLHWIIYIIGAITLISLCNFIFIRLTLFDHINWALFPQMLKGTFAVGIFPTIVIGALALVRQETKYQKIAGEINQNHTHKASASLTLFGIPSTDIRYIEAMQNYINVVYIGHDGELVTQTERATMKSTIDQCQNSSIVACHRSFLVNKASIIQAQGNAQGLLLTLKGCGKQVPVSRSFVSKFRDL